MDTIETDVCVIGSGAGGAVMAKELAEAGRRVIVLEKGRRFSRLDFTQLEADMVPKLYEDAGMRATSNQAIIILHAKGVGGTTLVNNNICLRAPEFVLEEWSRLGIERITPQAMRPYYERVEWEISVSLIQDEAVSRNDRVFHQGAERLNLEPRRFMHNRVHCIGCGFCMVGCSYDRKQNMVLTYLPKAERAGAKLFSHTQAEGIERQRNSIKAVIAFQRDPDEPGRARCFRIQAQWFIVSGGSISTPAFLLRNGLGRLNRNIGRHLTLHPILPNVALMPEPVYVHEGIPQCEYVDRLSFSDGAGFLLEGIGAQPAITSLVIATFGSAHHALMEQWNSFNVHYVMVKDRPQGRVRISSNGSLAIDYRLHERDQQSLRESLKLSAQLYFAAGARQVLLNHVDLPLLRGPDDVQLIDRLPLEANRMALFAPHQMSSCRMGADARTSVTDAYGKVHGMENLYIADASVFATSLGHNPQLTIMALATRNAEYLCSRN